MFDEDGLTEKQKLFVQYYLQDPNGTQAAIKAGYTARNAKITAYKTLRNPKVQAEIKKQMAAKKAKFEVTGGWVVDQLVEIVKNCMDPDFPRYNYALPALEKLGRHTGIFEQDNLQKNGAAAVKSLSTANTETLKQIVEALADADEHSVAGKGSRSGDSGRITH